MRSSSTNPSGENPSERLEAALAYAARGWPVLPLHTPAPGGACSCSRSTCSSAGKHPRITTGTDHATASVDAEQIRAWWDRWPEANVGIVTGARGGLVVLDRDPRNGGDDSIRQLEREHGELPPTAVSLTGGGGTHSLFVHPGGDIRIKAIAPGLDIKADGGLIVAPPSRHASGRRYEWELSSHPDDVPVATLPNWLLAMIRPKSEPQVTHPRFRPRTDDAEQLIRRARAYMRKVPHAVQGQHGDDATFKAACVVVRGFALSDSDALFVLSEWNKNNAPPWSEADLRAKVENARAYGDGDFGHLIGRAQIIVPGRHARIVDGKTTTFDVRENDFADSVIEALPPGEIYWRGNVVGVIAGTPGSLRFEQLPKEDTVLIVSKHCDFVSQRVVENEKEEEDGPSPAETDSEPAAELKVVHIFEYITLANAGLVLAAAKKHPLVRHLQRLVTYPVYGPQLELTEPGWNEASGTYFDATPDVAELSPLGIRADEDGKKLAHEILDDLVIDFPFKNTASKENFFLLMLTALLRAVLPNVPWFFADAPLERTGKSKLIDEVFGLIILGKLTPGLQLKEKNEETEKDITTLIIEGDNAVNFDNVRHFVDSPALASLLTRRIWSGRILGFSKKYTGSNDLVLCGTGNHLQATGEISKRVVPLELQPKDDKPELRTDFKHPDLPKYATDSRPRIVALLLGMVEEWKRRDRPPGSRSFGGFEGLVRIAGGVLELFGFQQYLTNRIAWLGGADDDGQDERAFVDAWAASPEPGRSRTPGDLLEVARPLDLFAWVLARPPAGQVALFGRKILKKLVDRPVGPWIIRRTESGNASLYRLERGIPDPAEESEDSEVHSSSHAREEDGPEGPAQRGWEPKGPPVPPKPPESGSTARTVGGAAQQPPDEPELRFNDDEGETPPHGDRSLDPDVAGDEP